MQANVGSIDRIVRTIVGPGLTGLGVAQFRRGKAVIGALGVVAGTFAIGTAVIGVCPVNRVLGRDTRSQLQRLRDSRIALRARTQRVAVRYTIPAAADDAVRLA